MCKIVLRNNIYPAQDHSLLLEAYRIIDTDKKGYIDLHTLENILKNFKDTYNKTQIKELEEFINDNENDFLEKNPYKEDDILGEKVKVYKSKKFFYENYIRKVLFENKKHMDCLTEDYYIYYNQYLTSKGIK